MARKRKKNKINKIKFSPFIAGIAGVSFYLLIIFSATFSLFTRNSYANFGGEASNSKQSVINIVSAQQTDAGLPIRLKIPKIKVDTVLESVGLTSQGEVGIPKGPVNAAWFNLGPRPGDIGSAVITGHYGVWKGGLPTVFNNLYKLRQGDKLYVKDSNGTIMAFTVRESRAYGENEVAPDVFGSSDGGVHLNLITCQGIWNKNSKSYSKRLVVFTDKE